MIRSPMAKQTFYNLNPKKQQKIIDAAMNEIAEKGYDLASIQNIIKDASIPRGSFYQYFTDKEDLFFEILAISGREKLRIMAPAFTNLKHKDLFTFLRELVKYGFIFGRKNPLATKVFSAVMSAKSVNIEKLANVFDGQRDGCHLSGTKEELPNKVDTGKMNTTDLKSVYRGLIQKGIAEGTIRESIPVESTVIYIESMFSTLGSKVFVESPDPLSKETEQIYYDFMEILQRGIGKNV